MNLSRFFITDGAMGTMLQAKGLPQGSFPEEWNLAHPEVVKDIHTNYLQAGANIILTNTFGANRFKLGRWGKEGKAREFNLAGAKIAREAIDDCTSRQGRAYVAGNIGPTGELLPPLGTHSGEELFSAFLEQAQALAEGGVDLILIETMTALDEAVLAVKAAKETGLPVIASMSFELGKEGYRTVMGVDIGKAVRELASAGADGVGSNCGVGPRQMVGIIEEMSRKTSLPILAEPNAGIPKLIHGRTVYDATPGDMAREGGRIAEAGANIVGGCCGTTPSHIQAIADELKPYLVK